jgi:hypothetical protein
MILLTTLDKYIRSKQERQNHETEVANSMNIKDTSVLEQIYKGNIKDNDNS